MSVYGYPWEASSAVGTRMGGPGNATVYVAGADTGLLAISTGSLALVGPGSGGGKSEYGGPCRTPGTQAPDACIEVHNGVAEETE